MKTSKSVARIIKPSEEISAPRSPVWLNTLPLVATVKPLQRVCQFTQPNVKRGQQLLQAGQLLLLLTTTLLASSYVLEHKAE